MVEMMEYNFQGWVIKYIAGSVLFFHGSLMWGEASYLVVRTHKQLYAETHVVRS